MVFVLRRKPFPGLFQRGRLQQGKDAFRTQALLHRQSSQHLETGIREMVMGVKNPTRQFDQFSVVTEQKQLAHTGFGRRHQHRTDPVPRLEHRLLLGQAKLLGQIQSVLTDHQGELSGKAGLGGQITQLVQQCLQLIRRCTGLHLSLRPDQRKTIHHPERGVAGAQGQLLTTGQHHLQLQSRLIREQIPEVEVHQLPTKPGHAERAVLLMPSNTGTGCELKSRSRRRCARSPHPYLQTTGEVQPSAWITHRDRQGLIPII